MLGQPKKASWIGRGSPQAHGTHLLRELRVLIVTCAISFLFFGKGFLNRFDSCTKLVCPNRMGGLEPLKKNQIDSSIEWR